jgi:hypothetical protein
MRVMFRTLGLDLQESEFDMLLGDENKRNDSIVFDDFVDWLLTCADPFDAMMANIDKPQEATAVYKQAQAQEATPVYKQVPVSTGAVPTQSKIGPPLGKPKGPLIQKPFNAYYSANCLPNVEPADMMSLYRKFPKAADRLEPAKGSESAQPVFRSLPSVGTWLAKPVPLQKVTPFNKLASVGTWLAIPSEI